MSIKEILDKYERGLEFLHDVIPAPKQTDVLTRKETIEAIKQWALEMVGNYETEPDNDGYVDMAEVRNSVKERIRQKIKESVRN
jgi:hypothetical protein